jgi:hypothetical protein
MIWGAVAALLVSFGALAYAQLALPPQTLLSDYALVDGGMAPILIGMLALAVSCVLLTYVLAQHEPSRSAAGRVLLLAAAAALMLTALFPTDAGGTAVKTVTGEVHRWSAALVFTALPVAAWVLARRRVSVTRWRPVRVAAVAAAVTLAVYLAAHPASFLSPAIGGLSYYGFLARMVVVAEMGLLATLMVAVYREHLAPRPRPVAEPVSLAAHRRRRAA